MVMLESHSILIGFKERETDIFCAIGPFFNNVKSLFLRAGG
jgi:hypothetical protein